MSYNCNIMSPNNTFSELCSKINETKKARRNNRNNICSPYINPLRSDRSNCYTCCSQKQNDFRSQGCKEDLWNQKTCLDESSTMLENVLDISSTLVKIMIICGVHEWKANKALDIIIYAFMHFDEVAEYPGGKRKKRIRKTDFYSDLIRDCGLTKNEAKLAYSIVKPAFKAFYHKQNIRNYALESIDECAWKNAANQTIWTFSKSGASKSEVQITEKRILCAYENFVYRLKTKIAMKRNQSKMNRNNYWTCDYDHCDDNYSYNENDNWFDYDCNRFDPCKPTGSEPPLCGEFGCQIVCPPGSKHPQIICKDQCDRIFLRVQGGKVKFDPLLIESEARRIAKSMFPACDLDRMKYLKECLNVCNTEEVDSCDDKLTQICRDASLSILCDDDDEVELSSEQEYTKTRIMSLSAKIENTDDGHILGIIMNGYCSDSPPPDFNILIIFCNDDSPLKFSCTQLKLENRENNKSLSPEKRYLVVPEKAITSISIKFATIKDDKAMVIDVKGYGYDNGHIPKNITALKILCNDIQIDYACTSLESTAKKIEKEIKESSVKQTQPIKKTKENVEDDAKKEKSSRESKDSVIKVEEEKEPVREENNNYERKVSEDQGPSASAEENLENDNNENTKVAANEEEAEV